MNNGIFKIESSENTLPKKRAPKNVYDCSICEYDSCEIHEQCTHPLEGTARFKKMDQSKCFKEKKRNKKSKFNVDTGFTV